MRLAGKVGAVTGASTGIGQAIAVAFASEGARGVVDYVGSASSADGSLLRDQGRTADADADDRCGACQA